MVDKRGSLMFISFDDLIMKFARYNDLGDYSILIASHELAASLKKKSTVASISTGVDYESKYDNIEFVSSLRPPVGAMEFCYSGNRNTFIEMYNSHLLSAEPMNDLCAIVDMIINNDCDVLIVNAAYEYAGQIPNYLQMFILDQFDLQSYLFTDLEKLSTTFDNKDEYRKVVRSLDIDIPKEFDGKDFDIILRNYGDINKIRERLELQKGIVATMLADPGTENDITTMFWNKFTENLEDKVRDLLMKRSENDIKDLCRAKTIRISPGSTKEQLVDKILHELKLTAQRIVEYE